MLRSLLVLAFVAVLPSVTVAQARPSASEAQALLQARPELVQQLRQRIITSGMTAEQVRARLRAEGYPENLLDAYLPGSTASPGAVGEDILGAARRLGIVGEDDLGALRTMMGAPTPVPVEVRDERAGRDQADADLLFGLELFRGATSEFLPTLDGPVDANYRLGPGDQLVLILTGQVELAHTLDVTREGFIVIPQVGQLSVANLTMAQLENLLYQRLPRSYSGVRRGTDAPTRFSVSVSRLRAIQVYVTGDVVRPSSYRISSAGTAMTALYAAGGPTESGTMREIVVRRGGDIVGALDVYDYLLKGDNSGDLRLENGDVVFVRTHGLRVRVAGEVTRPATYELRPGETLRDVLVTAGGFRPTAVTRRVQIERILPPAQRATAGRDRTVIDVTSDVDRAEEFPTVALSGGDVVRVFAVAERVRNRVEVQGAVWKPGTVELSNGLKLSEALRAAGGVRPDAYLGQVLVTRRTTDEVRVQLRAVLRDTTGAVVDDITLQEDDAIRVFGLEEFRPEQGVTVLGAVNQSARFAWREGMTLRDVLLLAGGLREGAYLTEVEVARLPADRRGGTIAQTIRVPIDSSYLVDQSGRTQYSRPAGLGGAPGGAAAEFTLAPYDNILVLQQPDWELQRIVNLTGEVRYPGPYSLRTKTERISDIIARAGGLTAEADAGAALVERARRDVTYASESNQRIRVGIDLVAALRRPGGTDDLILDAGDAVAIPTRRTTVEVVGAVYAPRALSVEPGRRLGHYIRAAGGASPSAESRRAYVVQPDGRMQPRRHVFFVIRLDPTPRAGATIVVPTEETQRTSTQDRVAVVAMVAQTLTSIAAVFALLR